jgi:hypothetical protein
MQHCLYFIVEAEITPRLALLLIVNEFAQHDLVDTVADIVHHADPRHLIAAFQLFGDTFLFGELFYKLKSHFFRLLIDLSQIRVQRPVHSHNVNGCRTVFFQVLIVALTPNPYVF